MSSVDAAASEAWRGEVPATFTLAADEVTALEPPPPYHACLPRQALLPLVIGPVRDFFTPFGPPLVGAHAEMWISFRGKPVRWEVPIGPLADLLLADDDADDLPWQLTVHLQGFPTEKLMRCSAGAAEAHLLNTLKEACYLLCGSAAPAMALSSDAQQHLTRAIAANHYDEFKEVGAAISRARARADALSRHVTQVRSQLGRGIAAQLGDGASARAVPIRLYTSPATWRQLPFPPTQPSGEPTLLIHALKGALSAHFSEEGGGDGVSTPSRAPAALVQGVPVPLDTPLEWLGRACAHPDGFLYVCVRLGEPAPGAGAESHSQSEPPDG